jgi:hypothetical protein
MNITSPILAGAARVAELPGDSVTSLLKMVGSSTGLFDDGADGGLGLVMSALPGVAAALAVAILSRSISAAAAGKPLAFPAVRTVASGRWRRQG